MGTLIAGRPPRRTPGPSVFFVTALLASGAARAQGDALESVRAALRELAGTTPVKAALERAVTADRKDRPLEAGRVNLDVTAGDRGISIAYPAGLLEQVRAERADPDPEQANPVQKTLENFDAIDVAGLFNAAAGLLTDLEGATLRSDTAAEYDGQPARLLELELVVRVSKADRKWLKSATRTMKLWTTVDGVPLAEESEAAFTVGLLIFTFDATEGRAQSFARKGDRLLAVRRTTRFDGEGLGESQHTTSETTLRIVGGSPTHTGHAGR